MVDQALLRARNQKKYVRHREPETHGSLGLQFGEPTTALHVQQFALDLASESRAFRVGNQRWRGIPSERICDIHVRSWLRVTFFCHSAAGFNSTGAFPGASSATPKHRTALSSRIPHTQLQLSSPNHNVYRYASTYLLPPQSHPTTSSSAEFPLTTTTAASNQRELPSPPSDAISALTFAPNSNRLIVSSWDKYVHLYDAGSHSGEQGENTGRRLTGVAHAAPVLDTCYGEDDGQIFSGGLDWTVNQWVPSHEDAGCRGKKC